MNKLKTALATRAWVAVAARLTPQLRREEGQTFVEYAMILALIAVLLVGALTFLHDQVAGAYSAIAGAI